MTMRICVLGNSHVAALKEGWDSIRAAHPGVDLVFFASRADRMRGMTAVDGCLVAANASLERDIAFTSGGRAKVVPSDFDLFLICGGLMVPRLDRRLSSAVRMAVVEDVLAASLAVPLARKLRSVSERPIWLLPTPRRTAPPGVATSLATCLRYAEVHAMLAARIDLAPMRLVAQPAHTMPDGWHSAEHFSRGSKRLDIGDSLSGALHEATDVWHMNGDYGRVCLEDILPALHAA